MKKKRNLVILSIAAALVLIIALAASLGGGGSNKTASSVIGTSNSGVNLPPLPASLKYVDRGLGAIDNNAFLNSGYPYYQRNCFNYNSGAPMLITDALVAQQYIYDPTFNPHYTSSSGAIGVAGITMSGLKGMYNGGIVSDVDGGLTGGASAVPTPNNSSGNLNSIQPYNLSFQVYNEGGLLCHLMYQYRTNVVAGNNLITPLFWYACDAWSAKCDGWTNENQVPAKQAAVFMATAKKINALAEAMAKSGKNYLN